MPNTCFTTALRFGAKFALLQGSILRFRRAARLSLVASRLREKTMDSQVCFRILEDITRDLSRNAASLPTLLDMACQLRNRQDWLLPSP
jgi:hypothetical protein